MLSSQGKVQAGSGNSGRQFPKASAGPTGKPRNARLVANGSGASVQAESYLARLTECQETL